MTPDDFFASNREDATSFVRRGSISPFLGQFISYQYGNSSILRNQERANDVKRGSQREFYMAPSQDEVKPSLIINLASGGR
jgi:hypothetical protein